MRVVSRYCDSCGTKIPAEDIAGGAALQVDDAYYCAECKVDVLPLVGKKEQEPAAGAAAGGARSAPGAAAPEAPPAAAAPGGRKAPASRSAGSPPAQRAAARRRLKAGAKEAAGAPNGAARRPVRAQREARAAAPAAEAAGERRAAGGAAARAAGGAGARGLKRRAGGPPRGRSGSGERAPAPRRSGPPMGLILGGCAAAGVLIVIVAVMAAGPRAADTRPARPSAEQLAAEAAARSERLFQQTQAEVGEPRAEQLAAAIARWSEVRAELSGEWATKAEAEIARLRTELDQAAAARIAEVAERAGALAAKGQLEEALQLWAAVPGSFRRVQAWADKAMPEIERLERLALARAEAEPLLAKAEQYAAAGEYERALGVLEGFDLERYRDTTWGERIAALREQYRGGGSEAAQQQAVARIKEKEAQQAAERERQRAQKRRDDLARLASMPWENLGVDLMIYKLPEPTPKESWKPVDKELHGTAGAALSQWGGEIGAIAGVGKPDWQDYLLELEYKVVRGSFSLGVRASGRGFVKLEPELVKDGNWHKLTVLVYGYDEDAFQEMLAGGRTRKIAYDSMRDSLAGGICFALHPQSEVHFRDIKVKVINRR
ncbi:MAG: hypothetical protein KatS3mg102_0199 [Planctomycetota bacterium]|nr:MAG: hypothetical protein KatS3mg102_0199 [Planctomycetota bacterium]